MRKYGPEGGVLWTRQFGTTELDEAYAVSADVLGGVYVVGSTYGTLPGAIVDRPS